MEEHTLVLGRVVDNENNARVKVSLFGAGNLVNILVIKRRVSGCGGRRSVVRASVVVIVSSNNNHAS